jgi:tetratricopeptide (TPR) repeat protein
MFATLGWLYGKLGEYERAVGMFERAVAEARASFGTDERTGGALDGLAQNLLAAGRAEEAESAIRESLRMRMAAGSPDTLVAGSYSTLGVVLSTRGQYEEAREAHLASLARESRGEAMATDLNNLGAVVRHLGDHDEAERYLRESVALGRERPDDRSGLATSLGNLGSLRRERGDLVEAERLQREALAIRETVLGPDHPDVAISLEQIGLTLSLAGRAHEADSLLSRAVDLRRRVLGEDHPETMASLNNLATVRFRRGDYLWAAAVQERVVAAARISDPTLTSRGAITMLHNLGVMRLRAGDLPVAERHLTEALAGRRRLFDDDHPDVASSLRWLSELRRMQGRFAEAESLGRQALERFEVLFPPGHARIAEAQVCVGSALVAAGRASEAAPLLRAALEAREAAFPAGNLAVAEAQAWLGTSLARTGDAAEARRLLQAAVSAYEGAGRAEERDAIRARRELDRF